ncbi:hypothetical protein [Thermomicrobium sp.]
MRVLPEERAVQSGVEPRFGQGDDDGRDQESPSEERVREFERRYEKFSLLREPDETDTGVEGEDAGRAGFHAGEERRTRPVRRAEGPLEKPEPRPRGNRSTDDCQKRAALRGATVVSGAGALPVRTSDDAPVLA